MRNINKSPKETIYLLEKQREDECGRGTRRLLHVDGAMNSVDINLRPKG